MSKYVKLARITGWGPFLTPFAIGFAYACSFYSNLNVVKVLIAFTSYFASLAFAFALNLFADVDVDGLHDGKLKDVDLRKQPILSGLVSKRKAVGFCAVTLILSAFGLTVSKIFGTLSLLGCLASFLYSIPPVRLKARPIGDVASNVFGGIVMFLAGMNLQEPHFVDGFILFWIAVYWTTWYLPTAVADYEFDLKAGLNTTVVRFGKKGVYRYLIISLIVTLLCSLIVLVRNYDFTFKLYAVLLLLLTSFVISLIIRGKIDETFRINVPKLVKPSFVLPVLYFSIALLRYTLF